MARHARPHSAASVCRITGSRRRPASVCRGAIGAELLIGEGIVENPDRLTVADEADGARRYVQLGHQDAVSRYDLELQPLRIDRLAQGGLQGSDLPGSGGAYDVSAAGVDLGNALLDLGELAMQPEHGLRRHRGKLLQRGL